MRGLGHSRRELSVTRKGYKGSDLWVTYGKLGEEANTMVYKNKDNIYRETITKIKARTKTEINVSME